MVNGDSLPNRGAPLYHRARASFFRLSRRLRGVPLVVSFPKSGRTWLRVMLDDLGIEAEYSHAGSHVRIGLPIEELEVREAWCKDRPTLLLVRDPRDTAVSWYFQATRRRGFYEGPLSGFVRHPGFGVEKIARFNLMWAEAELPRSSFRIVDYCDLHEDPQAIVTGVARFFRASAPDDAIARAAAAGDFEVMKSRESKGEYRGKYDRRLEPGDPEDPESFKVRRGVMGGYVDYMDADDVAYCDEVLKRHAYWSRLRAAYATLGLRAEDATADVRR
jgi:hypothetical protein